MIETRKKARLTQQQLAKCLRRPQSFVAKYEGGERRIDVVEFIAFARAMGADPFALLRDPDPSHLAELSQHMPRSSRWVRGRVPTAIADWQSTPR